MSQDYSWIEKQINASVYPAKLAPAITRLMAARYGELGRVYHDKRGELEQQRGRVGRTDVIVPFEELTPDLQTMVERCWTMQRDLEQLNEGLIKHGLIVSNPAFKNVRRQCTKEEAAALHVKWNEELVQLDAEWKRTQADLMAIAKDLGHEQIKTVQAKIDPALLKRVEAVGAPKLIGGDTE